ncbi:hypothetical protein GQ600_2867 [Phytophthora cactorum]|nr:hypothetical protein GQ600_2867 [Phytophthora cactorum]
MADDKALAAGRTEGTNLDKSPSFNGVKARPGNSSPQGNPLSATAPYLASRLSTGSAGIIIVPTAGQLCFAQTISPSLKHNVPVINTACNQPLCSAFWRSGSEAGADGGQSIGLKLAAFQEMANNGQDCGYVREEFEAN